MLEELFSAGWKTIRYGLVMFGAVAILAVVGMIGIVALIVILVCE